MFKHQHRTVSSACRLFCMQNVKMSTWVNSSKNGFGPQSETNVEEGPQAVYSGEKPCLSKQAEARIQQLLTTTTVDKLKKSLKFDSIVFVLSSTCHGGVKDQQPEPVFLSAVPMLSTPKTLPPISVPMKLLEMILDKSSGIPLKWPECSGQNIAIIEHSGVANSAKMNYLKTLVTGEAKIAFEGMGCSGRMYHVAWRILEHDSGRTDLIVNAQLRKIHAYPFIKPHNLLEILRLSQVVSGSPNLDTKWTSVQSPCWTVQSKSC